jgi:hypothetical protein
MSSTRNNLLKLMFGNREEKPERGRAIKKLGKEAHN